MIDTQAPLLAAAVAALVLALFAGWRDRQRRHRNHPDRVGMVDWPTVQIIALIALAILVSLALHGRTSVPS